MDNYSPSATETELDNPAKPSPVTESEISASPPPLTQFQRYLRRVGCFLIFAVWLVCMTIPCFFVTLMVEGEVVHQWSDRPGDQTRLFRLEDTDTQGFGLSWGSLKDEADASYCVSTTTHYLVWEGEAEGLDYCECYEKTDGTWQVTGAYQADCRSEREFQLDTDTAE